jgi:hypothetical protein
MVQCALSYAAMCESALAKGVVVVEQTATAALPRVRSAGRAATAHARSIAVRMQASLDVMQASLDSSRGAGWLTRMLEVRFGSARPASVIVTTDRRFVPQALELEAVREELLEADDASADGCVRLSHSELAMIV